MLFKKLNLKTFLQSKYTNSQLVHDIISHQKNEIQNHNEISLHTHENDYYQMTNIIIIKCERGGEETGTQVEM